ncbi:MAG: methyl-accepting chemotaxis protein [Thermodesulfobacteriota bacterium]
MSTQTGKTPSVKMIMTRNLLSMGALVVLLLVLNVLVYQLLSNAGQKNTNSAVENMRVLDTLSLSISTVQVLEGELLTSAQQGDLDTIIEHANKVSFALEDLDAGLIRLREVVDSDRAVQSDSWWNKMLVFFKLRVPDYTRYQSLKTIENLEDIYVGIEDNLVQIIEHLETGGALLSVLDSYQNYKQDVREFNLAINTLEGNFVKKAELQYKASGQDNFYYAVMGGVVLIFVGIVSIILMWNRRLLSSVALLHNTVVRIEEGDFSELDIKPKDEIGRTALQINEAIAQYKDAIIADADRETTQEHLIGFLDVVSEAAEGDLTLKAPVTADAFGSVADAYNLMVESLADLLKETRKNADDVGTQSKNLMQIFQDLETGAEAQSTQIEKVTEAVEKSETAAQEITEKATLAQDVSTQVDQVTAKGQALVNDNIEGMQLIRVTVQVINKKMKTLSERLLEIGTISQLISEIATRTTILAMNASIEASRAGEQGRGFLVISDEIKRLADKSAEATKQINGVIKSIQTEAGEVTASLEEETKTVESQTRLAQDTGDAFVSIKEEIDKSRNVVTEISELSKAQLEMTKNVDEAMSKVVEISQIAQRHVKDSSKITTGLNSQSSELLVSVGTFRLPEDDE